MTIDATKERQAKAMIWLHIIFMSFGLVFMVMGMMIMVLEPAAYERIEISKVEAFGAMVMFAGLVMFTTHGVSPVELIRVLARQKE